jgi:hypothetical protein
MSTTPALDVSGLPGGKGMGAMVGAGSGSGYGALAGGAACLAAGPFFPLCLAVVLPTTAAVGAIGGAVVGAARTESVEAIEVKTKALHGHLVATPYNDLLARQLQSRLQEDSGVNVALAGSSPAVGVAPSLHPEIETDDLPWAVEVGVTEIGTEGKREFALRLVTTLRLRRAGSATVWQTAKEVQSETELSIDQWLSNDSMVLHAVLNRCIQQAARQLGTDLARPALDKPGSGWSASKYSSSCGDVAPPEAVEGDRSDPEQPVLRPT